MGDSTVIRSATRADVPVILTLIHGLADYENEPDAVVATENLLAQQLFGPQPGAEVVIAELDDSPVGFALFFHNFSTWEGRRGLYLEDLFVVEEARRRGVGRALMVHLARLAVERDCARFEWSVLDWNTPAIGFYRGIGAVGMDEWTVQRLDGDALVALAREAGG
ncbi:MAG TPA: GNAT family N-acetyltransferase [Gordonia sp. (in: high G+C Gram-positive bacteria)]|uniref:GNAT family N-acetyltransferase n=1 Tax=unclassified Gordonia (in: high G+C Gram-positive bacteria) TaxID=2657482 RepID=UPI000FB230B9|nr:MULTISPECIES: GNAT family N-acetyltransferase [unclassified Gordonia (in: high G+C Gram-positive bacteria)]RUP40682.1 MAG: GNAT family N-acetyltransferase [Gordonia sp. (in: high G+C Gram-positive bacteria)]HNP57528.1 GNAT family N-acetyltransferase [Gordonia sp. (in: high G+C Gram-positive bacteria)]HRC51087.1 GNAT family N-acetyltransferase [Gordonia sp. (in: high G+C Gram-positive bacteria)]